MDKLLKFPSSFTIKIMGTNHIDLVPEVCAIVASHSDTFNPEADIATKQSTKGNYLSISATITATSQQQLDNIYTELNKHALVKVTL
jgi:putative lipoic acid-binding regulatory protein